MSQILYLVRHGQTQANRDVVYAGRSEDGLLVPARKAAIQVAEYLSAKQVRRIMTSPQRRARETCAPLERILGLKAKVCMPLAEIEMGPWSGLTDHEIASRYPEEWLSWRRDPVVMKLDGFEGLVKLQERAVEWLGTIANAEPVIAAFTHETLIKVLVDWVTTSNLCSYRHLLVPNCSVSSIEIVGGSWRLRSLNEFVAE